jgi:hypothetical protein
MQLPVRRAITGDERAAAIYSPISAAEQRYRS